MTAIDVTATDSLAAVDPEVWGAIRSEEERQRTVLEMIASENYASRAVIEAVGSVLTNKYAEGYPKARYYQGNEFVDGCLQLFEILASDPAEMPPEAREMSPDERLADALWAVYDLRDFWRERASRRPVRQVRKEAGPGRNDPCPCGSGKKFKRCCLA